MIKAILLVIFLCLKSIIGRPNWHEDVNTKLPLLNTGQPLFPFVDSDTRFAFKSAQMRMVRDGHWPSKKQDIFLVSIKCFDKTGFMEYLEDPQFPLEKYAKSALFTAAKCNCLPILKALANDPRVNIFAGKGKVLAIATKARLFRNLEFLLSVSNKWSIPALNKACFNLSSCSGDDDCKNLLLKYMEKNRVALAPEPEIVYPHINDLSMANFLEGISKGDFKLVQEIVDSQWVDPSANGNVAIMAACVSGHENIVRYLLSFDNVDPSVENNYCLRVAIGKDDPVIVELIANNRRVDLTIDNSSLLVFAATHGMAGLVEKLLATKGINPNVRNNAALKEAAKAKRTPVILALLADDRINPWVPRDSIYLVSSTSSKHIVCLLNDPRIDPIISSLQDDGQMNCHILCHHTVSLETLNSTASKWTSRLAMFLPTDNLPPDNLASFVFQYRTDQRIGIPEFSHKNTSSIEVRVRCAASFQYWDHLDFALDEYLSPRMHRIFMRNESKSEIDQWLCTIDYALRYLFEYRRVPTLLKIMQYFLRESYGIDDLLSMKSVQIYKNLKFLFLCARKAIIVGLGMPHFPRDIVMQFILALFQTRTWP